MSGLCRGIWSNTTIINEHSSHRADRKDTPTESNPANQLRDLICRVNPSNREIVIRIREFTSEPIRAYPYCFQHTCPRRANRAREIRNIIMSKMNHNRPRFRNPDKAYESIDGSDIPAEFRNSPQLSKSKAELRVEAEEACEVSISKVVLQK